MTQKSCLFIKPFISNPQSKLSQIDDLRNFFQPAAKAANLELVEAKKDGVQDITEDILQKIDDAPLVLVDANCYEPTGIFRFSPCLYYYLAWAHALGNKTILVARSTNSLPPTLVRHHTLTYSDNVWDFLDEFKRVADEIFNPPPEVISDNPIQSALLSQHLAKAKQNAAHTQELLDKQEAQSNKQPPKIIFKPVDS